MAITTIIQPDHLLRLKLVLKSADDFTDEEAEKLLLNTEVISEDDIQTALDDIQTVLEYLREFRPKLYQKLNLLVAST